jgi:hypothetical protein
MLCTVGAHGGEAERSAQRTSRREGWWRKPPGRSLPSYAPPCARVPPSRRAQLSAEPVGGGQLPSLPPAGGAQQRHHRWPQSFVWGNSSAGMQKGCCTPFGNRSAATGTVDWARRRCILDGTERSRAGAVAPLSAVRGASPRPGRCSFMQNQAPLNLVNSRAVCLYWKTVPFCGSLGCQGAYR